ncbi:hypothetical protein BGC_56640 [Burkholderia sp. 3C]
MADAVTRTYAHHAGAMQRSGRPAPSAQRPPPIPSNIVNPGPDPRLATRFASALRLCWLPAFRHIVNAAVIS